MSDDNSGAQSPRDAPNAPARDAATSPEPAETSPEHAESSPAHGADDSHAAVGSKYIPPALVEPDAAARVIAASAVAQRAAARAAARALASNAPPAHQSPAGAVPFTSPDTVIDRSQYVIDASTPASTSTNTTLALASAAAPTVAYATAPATAASDGSPQNGSPQNGSPQNGFAHGSFANHGVANHGVADDDQNAQPRVVYVEAPMPPAKRNNRGVGSLLAALSALAFAALFAVVIFALFYLTTGRVVTNFLGQASFFVPVVLYAIGFVVLVLIANRAGWWAYVLGSIPVALFTYLVTIGVLLLLSDVVSSTPAEASAEFARALVNPLVIAAGVLAREVSLWTGLAISARGRRVKVQNAERQAQFERDVIERGTRHGHTSAAPRAAS
ncbi:hypothetical protein B0I08_106151 [Glaciihabitans tibetensis]|uniref:Uncharacterized protein n=1 Tax=Glaciihabitans tibetensis TaxID=1266600 RepID=A0A2T0VBJ8_9MICO|nr:hypothetical protein [Glaciihabitans tibetensis]PRY67544.1 hypothetical protein B0I08_106151 [Glaciihabitans tibetensis]